MARLRFVIKFGIEDLLAEQSVVRLVYRPSDLVPQCREFRTKSSAGGYSSRTLSELYLYDFRHYWLMADLGPNEPQTDKH